MSAGRGNGRGGARRPATMLVVLPLCLAVFGTAYAFRRPRIAAADLPLLQLPPHQHDFGILMPDSRREYSFTILNPLPESLRIDKSCGCTAARTDRTDVPPGSSFLLSTTLSARGLVEGIESHVTVLAHSDRHRVEAEFDLRCRVENLLDFPGAAGFISIGSWMLDQLPAETTVLVTRGKYPLVFDGLAVECAADSLSAAVRPQGPDAWDVTFRIRATDALGAGGSPVTFRLLDHGKLLPPSVVKQTYVEVRGPVMAMPPSLLLTVSPGERVQRTIAVLDRSGVGEPPSIAGASCDSSNASVSRQNDASPGAVTLDYTAPAHGGEDRGAVMITAVQNGKTYRLRVGYLAIVSGG